MLSIEENDRKRAYLAALLVFRKAEVESVKEDMRDIQRQNKFLEKEMAKLNRRREDFAYWHMGRKMRLRLEMVAGKRKKSSKPEEPQQNRLINFLIPI